MKLKIILATALLLLIVPMCVSQGQPQEAELNEIGKRTLTLYDNFGLVSSNYRGNLFAGYSTVNLEVAEKIDVSTIIFSSTDIELIEQKYSYDLVSENALYRKYLGMEIVVKEKGGDVLTGKLLSFGNRLVLEDDKGRIHIVEAESVRLPSLPERLTTEPTLSLLLKSLAGERDARISYLTDGVGWKANYNALLSDDERRMDISSSVAVSNNAGIDFEDVVLKLVAGDVSRQAVAGVGMLDMVRSEAAMALTPQFSAERFSDYHLYQLERSATIEDGSTTQIPFISDDVAVEKEYVFDSGSPVIYIQGENVRGTEIKLSFESKEVMPAGTVRTYKEDDDALLFLGEDSIPHTAKGEDVRLKIGESFEVIGERRQTDYTSLGTCSHELSYRIELRNRKDEDVTVTVIERVYGDVTVVESSMELERDEAREKVWMIPVESEGSTLLEFTLRRIC